MYEMIPPPPECKVCFAISPGLIVDGSIGHLLLKFSRIDVLLLDDFAMAPLKDSERRDFLEICDDRYQRRSMILTSQMTIAHWA